MLGDHWRVRWYRRKAGLFRGWFLTANRPDIGSLNPVLPKRSRVPDSVYWTDHSSLPSECLAAAEQVVRGEIDILSAGTANWRTAEFWKKHPVTGAPLPARLYPYTVDNYPSGDPNLALWASAFPFLPALAQAYRRLTQPVTHRRRVLFVKPDYWLIIDDFEGSGVDRCELFFQFAGGDVEIDGPRRAISRRTWGNLDIWQVTEPDEADVVSGQEPELRGWISLGYGDRRPAPSLRFYKKAELPVRFQTALIAHAADELVSVSSERDAVRICGDRMSYRLRVPETVTSLEDIVVEKITSDAAAVR